MEELTPKESINYMKKLGITTLTKKDENLNLALGGLDKGISPLEMAAAYATIANDGVYIEPTFYTKAENSSGRTVVKSKQEKKKVISEAVAFILQSILTEPVTGSKGTANYCQISGIDVAAKTGTTNDEYDRWLCGFTPYYTAVTWFGFDLNETINFNGKNPSGQIWSSVMKTIHSGLASKEFDIPKTGIETANICSKTGLLANSGCTSYYEYYVKGTAPTTYCSEHSGNQKQTTTTETPTTPNTSTESTPVVEEQTPTTPVQTPETPVQNSVTTPPVQNVTTREDTTSNSNTTSTQNTTVETPSVTPEQPPQDTTTPDTSEDELPSDDDNTFEQ